MKALYVWRGTLAPNDDAAPHPTSAGDFITRLRDIPGDRFASPPRSRPGLPVSTPVLRPGEGPLVWPAGTAIAPVPPPRPADTGPRHRDRGRSLRLHARGSGHTGPLGRPAAARPCPDADRAAQVARMMAVARDQRRRARLPSRSAGASSRCPGA